MFLTCNEATYDLVFSRISSKWGIPVAYNDEAIFHTGCVCTLPASTDIEQEVNNSCSVVAAYWKQAQGDKFPKLPTVVFPISGARSRFILWLSLE